MLKVEKLIPGGFGLATNEDGKKVFLWNALPGELVEEYEITKNKSSYFEAIATKIAKTSPNRAEPKDECFLSTSPWQVMDFAYENQQKRELVVELFREQKIPIETPEIITDGKDYFYRNKMEYALYYNHATEKIDLAFHTRGSHRKIPIVKSSIERPELFAKAKAIVQQLNNTHDEARRYQSLLLRCNQNGEVSGGLYENRKPHPTFKPLTDEILGATYSYSPNGFFQINLPVYELALQEIKQHIKTDNVLDLYSGVGTIGLSVAHDKNLTLVECDKSAYNELINNARATQELLYSRGCAVTTSTKATEPCNARPLGRELPKANRREGAPREKAILRSLETIFSKSEEALNYIAPDQTVILDPPRAGCDKKLLAKLLEVKPQTIIYLSCNPATQARDVKILLDTYKIDHVKTFNFFPHTPHIENLVILSLF